MKESIILSKIMKEIEACSRLSAVYFLVDDCDNNDDCFQLPSNLAYSGVLIFLVSGMTGDSDSDSRS